MSKGELIKGRKGGPVTIYRVESGYNLRVSKEESVHFKNKDEAISAFDKTLYSHRKAFGHSVEKDKKVNYFTGGN
jgi:hypothetical protein